MFFLILCGYCSIILETDANNIAGKVATNAVDGAVPFSEQVCLFLTPKVCNFTYNNHIYKDFFIYF